MADIEAELIAAADAPLDARDLKGVHLVGVGGGNGYAYEYAGDTIERIANEEVAA